MSTQFENVDALLTRNVMAALQQEPLAEPVKNTILDCYYRNRAQYVDNMIRTAQMQCRQFTDADFAAVARQIIANIKGSMMQSTGYYAGGMQPMMGGMMPPMQINPMMSTAGTSYANMPQGVPAYTPPMGGTSYGYAPAQMGYGMQPQQPMPSMYQEANTSQTPKQQAQAAPANVTPRGATTQQAPMQLTPPETIQVKSEEIAPKVVNRGMAIFKVPYNINATILKYQMNTNAKEVVSVLARTDQFVADPMSVVKLIAQKKKADDVTLFYRPAKLIDGNLQEMQKSFLDIKKIINNEKLKTYEKVEKIIGYLNSKTRGVGRIVEDAIMDVFNSFNLINPDMFPEAENMECLVTQDSTVEYCTAAAFEEFKKYEIHDPAEKQMETFLKDSDTLVDATYTELKRSKTQFTEWAAAHCVVVYPNEMYRYTTVDAGTTNLSREIGYSTTTAAGDDLEFFTMEAAKEFDGRSSSMIIQSGKTLTELKGTIIRKDNVIFARFA